MEEEWRPVANFEGYCVSNLGRVRSNQLWRGVQGRIRKLNDSGGGYLGLGLQRHGVQITVNVHRLVAEAFIPNPDGKPVIDHIDRNKQNNVVSNLRWATHSENHHNVGMRPDNTTGFKGVHIHEGRKKPYQVRTRENGKYISLGYFATKEEAAECYRLYHGE